MRGASGFVVSFAIAFYSNRLLFNKTFITKRNDSRTLYRNQLPFKSWIRNGRLKMSIKAHNRKIIVSRKSHHRDRLPEETLIWENMTFDFVYRWAWYFKYRAALLQVKYPKLYVDLVGWHSVPEDRTKEQIDLQYIKQRRTTCRRMITKYSNALNSYIENEKAKLIPDWENPSFLKGIETLKAYATELKNLENG